MAHGHEAVLGWEWDSVLLIGNPSLSSHSFEVDGSTTFPGSSTDHNHDHNHEEFQVLETASPEHMQTDSFSSGSQQMGVNQECRDPRFDCPNFLAGRVPCACTDNDDDDSGVSRKRSKPVPRCQVHSCGAELTNLKGYHQRHRVCLRCAHATRVMLRNQAHRYCQQCGKFHPICDFDEGKRSCRRKLERHNNRRRRKALETEDTLANLDSGEMEPRSDSSPAEDTSNTTKSNLFSEGEGKATNEGEGGFETEEGLPPATRSPSDKLISPRNPDEADSVTMESCVTMCLEPLAPPVATIVEEILPTSEPATNSPEHTRKTELQIVHKKDCLPRPEQIPVSSDSGLTGSEASRTSEMLLHHIAPREPEAAEQLVRGHDEESLLALLMEDSSGAEGSVLSQNGNIEVNETTHLWDSTTPPARLSKQANYSSTNPTGRISFKLYDWNPGDFPRQLRQQVMQWLSQMPVDLEGYIRSGCTILTLFVSMPQPMWEKLIADWTGSVLRLVKGQGGAFEVWNTGYLIARVGQQIVHIRGGEPVRTLCGKCDGGPMLEGAHPICVEAGVEQIIVMTGSSLHQSHSKLLVAFDGTYIKSEVLSGGDNEIGHIGSSLQATIPALHSDKYGTAFLEIEHNSGISNFIPLLVAEKKIVDEVRTLEQEMDSATTSCCSSKNSDSRCQPLTRKKYHDLLVDLGWVLRNYTLSNFESDNNPLGQDVQRLQMLLHFSVRRGWCTVAERVLQVAKRAGLVERIGFLENGVTALHVALLHHQYAVMDYLVHLMASLASSGFSGCPHWWDVDYPLSDGLTARQILALQAKTFRMGSAKLERKIFWRIVRKYVVHVSLHSVHHEDRNSCYNSEVSVLIPSEPDVRPKDPEDRASSGQAPGYRKWEDSGLTDQEEARFLFLNVDCPTSTSSSWTSFLRRNHVDSQVNSFIPYERSTCSVQGLNMYISRASKRRPIGTTVGLLLVCAGLCVMLQHPSKVLELSVSLRRCLWGIENGPV